MPYRAVTTGVAATYVLASVVAGGYAAWAAGDTFGARLDPDGPTRAQFAISVMVLTASVATLALLIGSGVAARRRWYGGRGLWVMALLAGCVPLLLAVPAAVARLHRPALVGLAVVAGVSATAVIVAVRSPAWPAVVYPVAGGGVSSRVSS